jgi:hypothetical protein
MCSNDFATVGAEMPIFPAAPGIETMGLRCMLEDSKHGRRRLAQSFDLSLMFLEERQDAARRGGGLLGSVAHSREEEIEPRLPIAFRSHPIEQIVVCSAVLLEIEAQVKDRLPQYARRTEQERDQQPSQAAVAVQERVD